MRKKQIRNRNLLEPLESRVLLSAAVQSVQSPLGGDGLQVQPVLTVSPTYQAYRPTGALAPFQTAGPQGFTPAQIRAAYGLSQVTFGSVAGDGTGQTIAIIDAYNDPTITSDLRNFDAQFGLADPSFRVVNQHGGTSLPPVDPAGAGNDNWEGEEALDVEWAHAMAPGASLILVEASDASPSNLFAAANWARSQPGVSVVSMSFGGNEISNETQYDSIFTTPTGHTGVTFVASTGDSGAPAGYPSYSPNVVAAGGTSLSINALGNYQSETAWSGSGGGMSNVEAQPAYQNGVVTQTSTARSAPDVAFDADPSTGVAIYDSYNNGNATPWEIIGGTSVAAPCWAGLFAVADQGRVIAGEGTLDSRTQTLPLLYSAPSTLFHSITTGNNGYSAGPGYNLVTGRGSPVANLLIPYLVSGTLPPPPPPGSGPVIASLSADSLTVSAGTPINLTANGVTDTGATGLAVTFYQETNGTPGLQTDPNTGDYAFSPVTDGSNAISLDTTGAAPGTYTFYAQLTDSSGAASAAGTSAPSITITITAPADNGPSIDSISASQTTVVSGQPLVLTANEVSDSLGYVQRVYFYEETNGTPGLQTGPGGDFAFRPTNPFTGFSIQLDTTGVTGSLTFYALAVDDFGNTSAAGSEAPSVTVNIASDAVPASPTNLTATPAGPSEINLAFSEADSGQNGFTIQRSQSPTFQSVTRLFTINRATALSYSDTGLHPGTRYYYRVEAFNAAGDSQFSNAASAATLMPATHLQFVSRPATIVAGQAFPTVSVEVLDAHNHLVSDSSSITLALAPHGNNATLSGTLTVPTINGVATFNDLSMVKAGGYRLVATDGGLPAARSSTYTITPDVSQASLAFISQPGTATVGRHLAPVPQVQVQDEFGNRIGGAATGVTISQAAGTANGSFSMMTAANTVAGIASFSALRFWQAGTYTLQAVDTSLPIATPAQITATITPGATMIPMPYHGGRYTVGQPFTLSANLSSADYPTVPFTGTASITDANGDVLGSATVASNGVARVVVSGMTAGSYRCTLNYAGDSNHLAGTSSTFTLVVQRAGTATVMQLPPAVADMPFVLSAVVNAPGAPPARTGTITFTQDGAPLATVALGSNSSANWTIQTLPPGSHLYAAVYSGDANFKPSRSSPLRVLTPSVAPAVMPLLSS